MIKSLTFFGLSLLSLVSVAKDGKEGWGHESEASIGMSGGNTDTQSFRLRQDTAYSWSKNTLSTLGHYTYGEASNIKNINSWLLGGRYERELNTKTFFYIGDALEGDEFKGYDYRYYADIGGKRFLIKNGLDRHLFFELGYRFFTEQRIKNTTRKRNETGHIIRAYVESGFPITESVSFKIWAELLPDISNSDNLAFNFEPSFQVALNKVFSLRMAYRGSYDAEPAIEGAKNYDFLFTNSLVAKFYEILKYRALAQRRGALAKRRGAPLRAWRCRCGAV